MRAVTRLLATVFGSRAIRFYTSILHAGQLHSQVDSSGLEVPFLIIFPEANDAVVVLDLARVDGSRPLRPLRRTVIVDDLFGARTPSADRDRGPVFVAPDDHPAPAGFFSLSRHGFLFFFLLGHRRLRGDSEQSKDGGQRHYRNFPHVILQFYAPVGTN